MERFLPFPKPVLILLAAVFGAAVVLYSGLWMYSIRWQSGVELGFDFNYIGALHAEHVRSVEPGGPAAKAGLKPGDRITAINGHPIEDRHMILDLLHSNHLLCSRVLSFSNCRISTDSLLISSDVSAIKSGSYS